MSVLPPSTARTPMEAPPSHGSPGGEGSGLDTTLRLDPLAGWHIPLLHDPAYLPLHPLLQRAVLLTMPQRLLQLLTSRPSLGPQVLVALRQQTPQGLIVTRRLNRSGSCWQVQHLRLSATQARRELAGTLLREAIRRGRGASSWIATASSLDRDRLAVLREQGFQPLRTDRLWRWPPTSPCRGDAAGLELRPLNRRTAPELWHLEQAACAAQLRQLLDRRVDDLLAQSHGRGWMLFDPCREQAVAAVRWIGEHAGGGHDVKLTVHPGWQHLFGDATALLLSQAQHSFAEGHALWLGCDVSQENGQRWLAQSGAEERGERVLMARSVWHRQELRAPAQLAARRLEAVWEQWQPRRQPMPTPVGPGQGGVADAP
ncbi:hypothetical protein CyaNS01_01070 [Cyanobium sp. NS01]|nr:hypothetical protein CyaNS01_01070 [Cyanobium sp. NS01]